MFYTSSFASNALLFKLKVFMGTFEENKVNISVVTWTTQPMLTNQKLLLILEN